MQETQAPERTFLFADLCGFTALTETHGDLDAASLAERFTAMAAGALTPGAVIVKTIGDAVMVAAPSPADAATIALALVRAVAAEPRFPMVRLGFHHGPCVIRDGDYFGAAVNLAARVAAHARAGQILLTEAAASRLTDHTLPGLHEAGAAQFKNIAAPVHLFELSTGLDPRPDEEVDPICRMRVSPDDAVARIVEGGQTFFFCSQDCARTFLQRGL